MFNDQMNSCNQRDMWEMNSWITKFVQFCILLLMHTHIFEVLSYCEKERVLRARRNITLCLLQ